MFSLTHKLCNTMLWLQLALMKKTDWLIRAAKNGTVKVRIRVAIISLTYSCVVKEARSKCIPLKFNIYRLITAYLLLRVNLDKIMHARWDFDASSARTRRVSALDMHQNWSASALFCLNSRAQSKYAVVNLIHTWHKQTFLSFIMW